MGKSKRDSSSESLSNQGEKACSGSTNKIGPSTPHDLTNDRISSFGGLLGLVKFFDAVEFKEILESVFVEPRRKTKMGFVSMLYGLIILLFIGFSRIWHFNYLQKDPMLCGFLNCKKLPSPSTYWRFLNSLGLNQSKSLLKVNALLREHVWQLCGLRFKEIHIDIDTTVETVFGEIEGARKGHNTQHRGKKGLRPILAFIEETREYLCGNLRKGETVSGSEFAKFIRSFSSSIPSCVKKVTLRGDGEFISGEACEAAEEQGYSYIFANKRCNPTFKKNQWYESGKKEFKHEYNSCFYQPFGWNKSRRFLAMRIPKKEEQSDQTEMKLFEDGHYKYRIFVTDKKGSAHKIIREYDKRADCENLVGESKREGLAAFPSKKFKNNQVFFQIVMLTFNVWRHLKLFAAKTQMEGNEKKKEVGEEEMTSLETKIVEHPIVKHTARIIRLKFLFIAAKIIQHDHRTQIKYSIHDNRVEEFRDLLDGLDNLRKRKKPWGFHDPWNPIHMVA